MGRRREVTYNILANIVAMLGAPDHCQGDLLAVSTAKLKPNRYDRTALGRHLWGQQIGLLAEDGLVVVHPYVFRERLTTVEPSGKLIADLNALAPSLSDLTIAEGSESIWLSARTDEARHFGEPAPKELVDYRDDSDSRRFRREMDRINKALTAADLTFDGKPQGPMALRRVFLLRHRTDPIVFALNGRLAGGWWLQLPADQRHRIRLNREPLADLDFRGMFVQLAYRSLDWELAEDFDPYAIPGLEGHRDGAKLAMLSLLGRTGRMRRLSAELKAALPEGWDTRRLREATADLHSNIASLFGRDIGRADVP
jgi:hypothetical protein